MHTLVFTPTEQGQKEVIFLSGYDSVLQIHSKPSKGVSTFVFFARISEDMPWVCIKTMTGAPSVFALPITLPYGIFVRITTTAEIISAGISEDGEWVPDQDPDIPIDTLIDSEGFQLIDSEGFYLDCL